MGGDQCGYLDFFDKEASYNAIPNSAPFVRPTNPRIFASSPQIGPVTWSDPITLSASDVATQKIAHDDIRRQYNKAQAVETALCKQIIKLMDEIYLQTLRDSATEMIQCIIPDIFDFLHNT